MSVDARGGVATVERGESKGAGPQVSWRPPPMRAVVARCVQVVGLFDAVTSVLPSWHHRMAALAHLMPTAGMVTARAATGVVGLLLVYLGAGLRRGKRRAWQLTTVLCALSVVLHLARATPGPALIAAVLLGVLLVERDRFCARGDQRNRWQALGVCAGFLGAGFVLGFVEVALRARELTDPAGPMRWAEHVALGMIGISGPLHFERAVTTTTVDLTTGAFGLLAFVAGAVVLLRPGTRRARWETGDEPQVRALLDRRGDGDSLGYFALRPDKSFIWAPSRRAAVAYRVVNGVSLASGDPLGIPSAWPEAITAWLADCAAHGWTPAVLACGTAGGTAYRRFGLDAIELGDEAVLDVPGFSLQGRSMRTVRQAVGRVRRAGYACQVVRQRDLDDATLAEARHCAVAYRQGTVERGFSMALSRFGDPADGDCLLVLCRDGDGRLRGLLQFVPWGTDGLSLDLMRGDRTAENGLTELMIVSAVEAAGELGVRRISLNFAVLRSVLARAEQLGAGPVVRIWARLLRAMSGLCQIETLYRANAKYQPDWQPRFLCFPAGRDLPRIAVAALSAEAFLPSGRRRLAEPDPCA
ncbi:membrane protein [Actinoplanes sp. NBRC 14428]|uniref:Lysyl-tRNA synthetase class 2 n=1 Tax=Pseudosporangium ferrugineum TaxID=439699 RepID=A0A2T0S6K4_9ACTN|nr:phosphatidylglycerol lysyltransferase domain-containing protein [Pseudosporangium ferrugineum]PRY29049.1 lysyl-tRNA synthetase class 2 [Pseudosporangium ferrugineum]BCJ53484.1 membrane protein [Actinoplanes sp. NBRC 14428]